MRFTRSAPVLPAPSGQAAADHRAGSSKRRAATSLAIVRTRGWAGTPTSWVGESSSSSAHRAASAPRDGRPIALGYHTGHWEIGLLMEAAAEEIHRRGGIPLCRLLLGTRAMAARRVRPACSIALPYRNDAAMVLRRLIRSLPTRRGVMGVGTCDKGLPAVLIALAGMPDLPVIVVPGGVTLPPGRRRGRGQDPVGGFAAGAGRDGTLTTFRCSAAGLAPQREAAASFWGLRPQLKLWGRRWGCRCRIRRWLLREKRFGSIWLCARRGR